MNDDMINPSEEVLKESDDNGIFLIGSHIESSATLIFSKMHMPVTEMV